MESIELALIPGGFAARVAGTGVDAEHAFILYHEGCHVARQEVSEKAEVRFALTPLPGQYEVAVLRRQRTALAWRRAGTATLMVETGDAPAASPQHEMPLAPQDKAAGAGNGPGAVLHIGLPKTGTTYLQRTFYAAFATSDAAPVDYPDTGFYNHQVALYEPLGGFLPWKARHALSERWQSLQGALGRPRAVPLLLSAEALSALSDEGVAAFGALLAARQVARLVITVRPLSSLLPSHWQQNMKQGGRGDLGAYAERMLGLIERGESPAQMFSYRHTVHAWRRVYPQAPITVLAMDGSHAQNLIAFARVCGLGAEHDALLLSSVPAAAEQNLSFSVDECRELLAINERIARGQLPLMARREAMDRFFQARESCAPYERPTLGARHRELAEAVDDQSRQWLRSQLDCEFVHGRDAPAVTQAAPPAPVP
jgi:hypothetical protein